MSNQGKRREALGPIESLKNQQFLAYLAKEHPSTSITSMMKLSYLIDLISVKKTDKQISSFNYVRYSYGPFTEDIYRGVETLVLEEVLSSDVKYSSVGREYVAYVYNEEKEYGFSEISNEEKKLIDSVLSDLSGYGAKALTEIAYKTKPMIKLGATLGGTENLFKKIDLKAS